jgi:hypothetical protein
MGVVAAVAPIDAPALLVDGIAPPDDGVTPLAAGVALGDEVTGLGDGLEPFGDGLAVSRLGAELAAGAVAAIGPPSSTAPNARASIRAIRRWWAGRKSGRGSAERR